ncbi:MAG: OmpH family outer membrane protein [Thermodesulfobacteriota bacterium]
MRKILICTMIMLLFPVLLQAQELKVGVVDLQHVLEESKPGKKAIQNLEQEFQGLQQRLDQRKSELDELREEMQKQSLVMSQEAQSDKESEFRQKVQKFQELYQEYQNRMQAKEKELREPIIEDLVDIIQDYGQEHGFDIILDKQNSGLVFNTEELEITEPILEILNQQWQEDEE